METSIVQSLHDLTQMGWEVYFSQDFKGMITVSIKEEFDNDTTYSHAHLNYPRGPIERLQKELDKFLKQQVLNKREEE